MDPDIPNDTGDEVSFDEFDDWLDDLSSSSLHPHRDTMRKIVSMAIVTIFVFMFSTLIFGRDYVFTIISSGNSS